ncbi:N-acetylglucosamine-6-phosphate deacetylase [Tsukamurella tyrosinosolvens]|uniref:N-acetylglucosamine-6-phosphate deacetylase n=1 Tax=Tsukamurella tyrosinosolvens TaxID=57704 RepID=UPI0021636C40|nr:amidohydrolase family protein [Tsukamurella tyrosinosolvens]
MTHESPAYLLRGSVVTPSGVLDDGVVAVRDGTITAVGPAARFACHELPPACDSTLLPGLVDIHCHGGGGFGFPDADRDRCEEIVRFHRSRGTTTQLASLVSAPPADLEHQIHELAPLVDGGEIAGIHIEGPFLSADNCGAQNPRHIADGDPGLLRHLLRTAGGRIKVMTVAPETPHFADLARLLSRHGAVASIGHTGAGFAQVMAAVDATAASLLSGSAPHVSFTHLFNGMAPFHHRAPGAAGAALTLAVQGRAIVELIADGTHIADETVSMVFALLGADRIALVSDAMPATGMPDGGYQLGSMHVTVADGVARLTTTEGATASLAGSTSTMIDVLRRSVLESGVDIVQATLSAATTPARFLGLRDRGALKAGLRADILELTPDLRISNVVRGGVSC